MALQDVTQDRLLESAGIVFAEKGFEGATVREICDRAEANVASVNDHFGGKERLYIEAVKYAYQLLVERVPQPELPPDMPPADKLRAFIRMFLERVIVDREPGWICKLIMQEVFRPTAACIEFVEGFVRPTARALHGVLAELLPAGTSDQQRHLVAFSIIGQCLHHRMGRPIILLLLGEEEFKKLSVDLLVEHITAFSLAGMQYVTPAKVPAGEGAIL